jgi:hypothetical protein
MGIRIRIPSAGFTRFAALVILFGAIVPQALYVGHWPVPGVTSVTAEALLHAHEDAEGGHHQDEGSPEHELHCHAGPSKCGGPQAMVASVWVGEDSGLLGLDSTPRAQSSETATLSVDPPVSRILQPPQSAA